MSMESGSTRELAREALAGVAIGEVVTVRGRELGTDATAADARQVFGSESVQVVPLLDGHGRYRGSVAREQLHPELADDEAVLPLASTAALPVVEATLDAEEALRRMDATGATRLVVVGAGETYVGLVCLRSDRRRLCVDAECHLVASPGT